MGLFKLYLPPLLSSSLQVLYVVEDTSLRPVRLKVGNGGQIYKTNHTTSVVIPIDLFRFYGQPGFIIAPNQAWSLHLC